MDTVSIWSYVLVLFSILLYFVPAVIGFKRGVNGSGILTTLNVFFGWTVIGWIVLLIWAVAGQTRAADAYYRQLASRALP